MVLFLAERPLLGGWVLRTDLKTFWEIRPNATGQCAVRWGSLTPHKPETQSSQGGGQDPRCPGVFQGPRGGKGRRMLKEPWPGSLLVGPVSGVMDTTHQPTF